jgi:hypothetical protein
MPVYLSYYLYQASKEPWFRKTDKQNRRRRVLGGFPRATPANVAPKNAGISTRTARPLTEEHLSPLATTRGDGFCAGFRMPAVHRSSR